MLFVIVAHCVFYFYRKEAQRNTRKERKASDNKRPDLPVHPLILPILILTNEDMFVIKGFKYLRRTSL